MELDQVLKSASQVLEQLKDLKVANLAAADRNTAHAKDLTAREEALKAREAKVKSLEDASAMLHTAKEIQEKVNDDRKALEKDRAAFSNLMVIERQKIRVEADKLLPIAEQADQVRKDKAALEVEKGAYKERIKKELIDALKAGKL